MGTAAAFVGEMRKMLGITESPAGSNRTSVGVAFGWNGVAWCAETVSLAAKRSGMDWWTASTDQMESWARTGRNRSRWLSRTTTPRPGDICVWDWEHDGTANHVSVVESVRSDGTLVTIGGNESNACRRAVRSRSGLRGFIRLNFATAPVSKPPISVVHPTLQFGSSGAAVVELQGKMNVIMSTKLVRDGRFGTATKTQVINFQKFFGLSVDGVVGPKTWGVIDYIYSLHH